ncbi:transcriptional regulator, DeoR family [Amphibacillus marinus]|uniref:Transcriptional regulator, DeoR family n=1 Tax=Amphibacillus marinus TaxID=872970 RepID=A0A1H8H2Q1_9BACI|nr:DeoR/GlpR family DNA-binding transcription regulator [Amphibacillus marinus]SEN50523.1 transcriptional regulator, DeoR family [Amphibacillus marinus]
MLVAERHQKIVEQITDKKTVKVTELSQLFSVTEETIRRDLERLEKDGHLIRSHGGAVYNEKKGDSDIPFAKREVINVEAKKRIARMAVQHVNQGETIILDASSTAWYMAQILPDMPLTVVTNALKVAAALSEKTKITVVCPGGTLLSKSLSFVGHLTEKGLDHYFVDKAFISCKGIHSERGLSESNEQQAIIKRKMLEISAQSFILLDDSKFGVQAFFKLASIESAQALIVNQPLDAYWVKVVHELNPDLKVVSPNV